MNIHANIRQHLGSEVVTSAADAAGVDPADASTLLDKAVPAVLAALASRASSPEGAHAVLDATNPDADSGAGEDVVAKVLGEEADGVAAAAAEGSRYSIGQVRSLLAGLMPAILAAIRLHAPNLNSVDGWMAFAAEQRSVTTSPSVEVVPRPGPVTSTPPEAARPPEGMGWLGWFLPLVLVGSTLAYGINQSSCAGPDATPPATHDAAAPVEGSAH